MKKFLSFCFCLMLLLGLATHVLAEEFTVTFTDDSLPEVGGTLTVDKYAMLDNGNITAEMYNALLEGNVIYSWYKNDMLVKEGIGAEALSYALMLEDQGCSFYVTVKFYEDNSFEEGKKCAEAVSGKITVAGSAPAITTKTLPDGTVGEAYYVKLECSDGDAVFSEFMGSQLSEFGMYLTQHGEIEGTPTKTGNCHVNVLVVSEGGGEDSVSYDITVNAAQAVEDPTEPSQVITVGPAETTDEEEVQKPTETVEATETQEISETQTETTDEEETDLQNKTDEIPWWVLVIVGVACAGAGVGIALLITKKKK